MFAASMFHHVMVINLRLQLQWNPSIAATLGEQNFGRYVGWPLLRDCFVVHLGPRFLAVIQRWPLFTGGRSEGFHCTCVCLFKTAAPTRI